MPYNDKFMTTVRLGPKGQIVIPKEVREMFGLENGSPLLLIASADKGIALNTPENFSQITDAILNGTLPENISGTPEENAAFVSAYKKEVSE